MSVVKDGEVQRVFDILDYLGGAGQAARPIGGIAFGSVRRGGLYLGALLGDFGRDGALALSVEPRWTNHLRSLGALGAPLPFHSARG